MVGAPPRRRSSRCATVAAWRASRASRRVGRSAPPGWSRRRSGRRRSRRSALGVLVVVTAGVLEQAEVLTDPAHRAAHGCCLPGPAAGSRRPRLLFWDITGSWASNRGPQSQRARVSRRPGSRAQVRAHPRREPGRRGWWVRNVARTSASLANAAAGSSSRGATAIRPRSSSMPASSTAAASSSSSAGSAPERPSRSGRVERDLEQHVDRVGPLVGPPRERADQLAPVDGLDHRGVRRDGGRLVALQPADEVPPAGRGRRTRRPWPRPPGGGSRRRR